MGGDTERRKRADGLTLVEVALFICILGVLFAVALPTFVRALQTSKMAEAPHELARIYAATAAYYATPQAAVSPPAPTRAPATRSSRTSSVGTAASALTQEQPAIKRLHCMPGPAGPTPEKPSTDPTVAIFDRPDAPDSATWRGIGYEPSGPIRYRYSLLPSASGCGMLGNDSHGDVVLSVRAEGDLDGDGVLSLFERNATLENGNLVLDPMLVIRDRVE
jgi:Tfp pilus assembly protein PilE